MFHYTDEPLQPHPSDRFNSFNDGVKALAFFSGAVALFAILMHAGLLS